jgi:hypothetical protein
VWSEAAIAEDDKGQILFIYSMTPLSVYELYEYLLKLNIGIVAAQHLEGAPLAHLYINVGDFELNLEEWLKINLTLALN